MESLHGFYARLLQAGLIVLRQAVWSNDPQWAQMEVQHLHNSPSLLNEPNVARHRYFWVQEREHYIESATQKGGEVQSRMLTYFEPEWREMEPAMHEVIGSTICH